MTKQQDILNDPNYIPVHNAGFVGLITSMGSDEIIERSARVSYGKGTRNVSDTRNLIRYLLRNNHTSPFEMCQIIWHIKMPIFCARQFMRHRTFSYNELSLRYSTAEDDFYIPQYNYVKQQSKNNKQGRAGELPEIVVEDFVYDIKIKSLEAYGHYENNLESGIARELSRIRLPLNLMTEMYVRTDIHNLMHFLKLRLDSHAQIEIRDLAMAMFNLSKPLFPITFEAFEDYKLNAVTFSQNELQFIKDNLNKIDINDNILEKYNLSKRESIELLDKLNTRLN